MTRNILVGKTMLRDPDYMLAFGRDTQRNAHSPAVKAMFGLRPEQKWPERGLPVRRVQGINVWVLSKDEAKQTKKFHRVRAECPHCGETMSAGRMHQHVCKTPQTLSRKVLVGMLDNCKE